MHLTPDGQEGYQFTAEEIYGMILVEAKSKKKPSKNAPKCGGQQGRGGESSAADNADERENEGENNDGRDKESAPSAPSAADLADLIASIKVRNAEISAEALQRQTDLKASAEETPPSDVPFDDHSFWEGDDEFGAQRDVWLQRMIEATDIIAECEGDNGCGKVPLAAERMIRELKDATLDWRTILNDFVQEEICDYSFAPPDKRMEDSPFFLPDFNEKDDSVKDILFMIDTSGSMSDEAITECYSEIYGAILQFNGKLQGKLGFFDAVVVEPIEFADEDEFKIIRPKGGGGTSFHVIFDYVKEKMSDQPPSSIVILTDGCAPFPDREDTNDIPALWIINNTEVNPPFGKVARIVG